MPQINTVNPFTPRRAAPLSDRERALMAQVLQENMGSSARAPTMPAGGAGLALALGNAGLSAIEGMKYKAAAEQEKAAQAATRSTFGHMVDAYGRSQPGAMGGATPVAVPSIAPTGNLPVMARGGVLGNPQIQALQASEEQSKGLPPGSLGQFAQIESHGNPNALNKGSGASGLYQFIPSTAAHYNLADPTDPAAATKAAANLMADNAASLRRGLGRDPTAGELYLAHQQGAGGALALLQNPDAPAASLVGSKAVLANGGHDGMSGGDFARMWTSRIANSDPGVLRGGAGDDTLGGPIQALQPNIYPSQGGLQQGLGVAEAQKAGNPSLMGATLPPDPTTQGGPPAPSPAMLARALMGGAGGNAAQQPIPGSAYAPPASLGGGAIDANVTTAAGMPGPDPSAIGMGAPTPNLTAANPNASAFQAGDMANNAPIGGMGGPVPASAPASPIQSGGAGPVDPSMQSLAMALQAYPDVSTPGGTTPKGFAPLPGSDQPALQQGAGIVTTPAAVSDAANGVDAMQAAGLPSFGGLPQTNGKRVALSNSPDLGAPDAMAGLPAPQNPTARNVPEPSSDPSSGAAAALGSAKTDAFGQTIVRPSAPTLGGHAPPGTVYASDADPDGVIGGGGSSSAPLQGNSRADQIAPMGVPGHSALSDPSSPQSFMDQQSGGAPGSRNLMASILQGAAPASSASGDPGASQRLMLANILANRAPGDGSGMPFARVSQPDGSTSTMPTPGSVGPGSAFRSGMDGGDLHTIAATQFDNLGGNMPGGMSGSGQGGSPNMMLARALNPNMGSPSVSTGWQQDAAAIMSDPNATSAMQGYAAKILEQAYAKPEQKPFEHYLDNAGNVHAFDPNTSSDRIVYQGGAKPADPTSEQRDYDTVVQQAQAAGQQPPSFADYQQTLRRSGAATVSVDTKAENAEAQGRGQGVAKRFNDLAEAGTTAQGDALVIDRLGDLLGSVQTGPKTAALERLRQMTSGAVSLDPNASNVQALNAAVQYLAPRLRVAGSGAQSDRELGNFLASIPTLAGTPEGNAKVLDTLRGMVGQKQAAGRIAQQWQLGQITAADAQQQLDTLPSPFAAAAQGGGAGAGNRAGDAPSISADQAGTLPTVASPADAARLSPGTMFKTPDGRVLRR